MRNFFLAGLACSMFFLNCRSDEAGKGKIKVAVSIESAYHEKIYLEQEPFNDEHATYLDSGIVKSGLDTFMFYIPGGEERLYAVTVAESGISIPFITDTNSVQIHFNYASRKYTVKNSAASEELKAFNDGQLQLAKTIRPLKRFIDSVKEKGAPVISFKDSVTKFDSMAAYFYRRYKNFADTVHSPAAFLAVYNNVDFGNDRKALKAFITATSARFPHHSIVQTLAKNVLDYIKAVDEPYKVGDTLPGLVLPDEFGIDFSTYSLKGKYVLINIWSTFCDVCAEDAKAAAKAKQLFPAAKFEAVSIALDDQKPAWLSMIKRNNYNWPQLIDEKMWNGTAFKSLRFDSIPYNFIIAPDGRLLAKAVRADSIVGVLQKAIK